MTKIAAPPAAESALPLAGRGRRFAALTYESLLLVAVIFITGFIALPLITPGHAGTATTLAVPPVPQRVALFCIVFAVLAWYCVACWTGTRQTLPMKTWRLRIVMADGAPATRRAALLRFLAAWIGPSLAVVGYALLQGVGLAAQAAWLVAFNFLWCFVDPERQFLHDRIAGTRIVLAAKKL